MLDTDVGFFARYLNSNSHFLKFICALQVNLRHDTLIFVNCIERHCAQLSTVSSLKLGLSVLLRSSTLSICLNFAHQPLMVLPSSRSHLFSFLNLYSTVTDSLVFMIPQYIQRAFSFIDSWVPFFVY